MRIIYAIVGVLLFQTASAQTYFTRQQTLKDAKALETMFFKIHPSPFHYISKDSVKTVLKELVAYPGDSIDALSWENRVRKALIPLGCGHTYMYGYTQKRKGPSSKRYFLPFSTFHQDGRTWVTGWADTTSLASIPKGAEIVAINEVPNTDILKKVLQHQPSDGYNRTFAVGIINRYLTYNNLYGRHVSADSIQYVKWRDEKGILHHDRVRAVPANALHIPPEPRDTSIKVLFKTKNKLQRFYFHPDHPEIGVLQIRSFKGRRAHKMYQKAIAEMEKRHTPYLVIDVRNNTGGSFSSTVNLVRYTAQKKFSITMSRRLFRSWKYQKAGTLLERLPVFLAFDLLNYNPRWIRHGKVYYKARFKPSKKHHFDGQVFVLTNGMSFSASSQAATFLKEKSNAVVIGSETGGGSKSLNGMQIPVLRLPGSKLGVHIPQMHLNNNLGPDEGKGVEPHIPTHYTIEDVLNQRDLDWEAVLQWIETHRETKSGN